MAPVSNNLELERIKRKTRANWLYHCQLCYCYYLRHQGPY